MNRQNVKVAPDAKPLDEAVWQAWLAKGCAADERGRNSRLRAMKLASITMLLFAAVLWSRAMPFEIAVRFLVVSGQSP